MLFRRRKKTACRAIQRASTPQRWPERAGVTLPAKMPRHTSR